MASNRLAALCVGVSLFAVAMPTSAQEAAETTASAPVDAEAQWQAWAREFDASLDKKTGQFDIAGHQVALSVPEGYYYLDKADARRVLEDAWGNPEDDTTLGMIFPADVSPLDDGSIGVNLTFDADGYVSDEDAGEIDYDDLMTQMKRGTREENEWRADNGYGAIELVGWAERPTYDAADHEMVWAKHLRFLPDGEGLSEEEIAANTSETLNYNVRELGRKGVLQANFIAGMGQLDEVRTAVPDILSMIEYKEGYRYTDYREGDKVATYGLAGLVAGGGLLAKKAGLIGVILIALKKFWFLIAAGAVGAFGAIKRSVGRGG